MATSWHAFSLQEWPGVRSCRDEASRSWRGVGILGATQAEETEAPDLQAPRWPLLFLIVSTWSCSRPRRGWESGRTARGSGHKRWGALHRNSLSASLGAGPRTGMPGTLLSPCRCRGGGWGQTLDSPVTLWRASQLRSPAWVTGPKDTASQLLSEVP